jgi:hypothetical protein
MECLWLSRFHLGVRGVSAHRCESVIKRPGQGVVSHLFPARNAGEMWASRESLSSVIETASSYFSSMWRPTLAA